jgi:hypothetical protein
VGDNRRLSHLVITTTHTFRHQSRQQPLHKSLPRPSFDPQTQIAQQAPCGRRWREAPDEGFSPRIPMREIHPRRQTPHRSRRRFAPSIHLLPQGEKGRSERHEKLHTHCRFPLASFVLNPSSHSRRHDRSKP